ncbi:MAG: hypothetical protein M1813_009100 [Trichoglossum hirsutum]|nr:MAG: hypothetical protein M1813_009100 [Trichoglossum hirsutum]
MTTMDRVSNDNKNNNDRAAPNVLFTFSYLTFFSLLGTLARLGLTALTSYPNAPATMGVLWANFAGCAVMGFLSEGGVGPAEDTMTAPPAVLKKSIPFYVGLSTGFCGSLTSFSSFTRDAFLSLSNTPPSLAPHRNAGFSFLALLATIILTLALSLSALHMGAHIAFALSPVLPSVIPPAPARRVLDRLAVIFGFGCWIGAVVMVVWPPDRPGGPAARPHHPETWRHATLLALALSPPGTLLRFYASLLLNPLLPSFPLGTFASNVVGTLVLSLSWSLQHTSHIHAPVIACQALQGIQDGFCGCLTTVSTWVVELKGLSRRRAYCYGGASVCAAVGVALGGMGPVRWSRGFGEVTVCG